MRLLVIYGWHRPCHELERLYTQRGYTEALTREKLGKTMNHAPGSLEEMVENLVKNWEVEASFKPRLSDWRTIDHERYSFAMGGGPPQYVIEQRLFRHLWD